MDGERAMKGNSSAGIRIGAKPCGTFTTPGIDHDFERRLSHCGVFCRSEWPTQPSYKGPLGAGKLPRRTACA